MPSITKLLLKSLVAPEMVFCTNALIVPQLLMVCLVSFFGVKIISFSFFSTLMPERMGRVVRTFAPFISRDSSPITTVTPSSIITGFLPILLMMSLPYLEKYLAADFFLFRLAIGHHSFWGGEEKIPISLAGSFNLSITGEERTGGTAYKLNS